MVVSPVCTTLVLTMKQNTTIMKAQPTQFKNSKGETKYTWSGTPTLSINDANNLLQKMYEMTFVEPELRTDKSFIRDYNRLASDFNIKTI